MWTPQTLPHMVEKAAREYLTASDFLISEAPDNDQVTRYAESLRMTAALLDATPMMWLDTDVSELVAGASEKSAARHVASVKSARIRPSSVRMADRSGTALRLAPRKFAASRCA